jgi:hypothetical protein
VPSASLNAILSILRALPRTAKAPLGSICVHEVCEVLNSAGRDISGVGEISAEMPFLFSVSSALTQLQSDLNGAGAFAASSSTPTTWPTSDAKALQLDDTTRWLLSSAFLTLASSPLSATRALAGIIDLTHSERQAAWLTEREEAAKAALDKQLSLLPELSTVSKIKQIGPPSTKTSAELEAIFYEQYSAHTQFPLSSAAVPPLGQQQQLAAAAGARTGSLARRSIARSR